MILLILLCMVILTKHYIEQKHEDEADGKTDGAEIGVFALVGFGDELAEN